MSDPSWDNALIQTKFHRPMMPVDLVKRQHLTNWLDERCKRPLTLVSAPAGYGKSTLVSSWLDTCKYPHTWLTLDEQDNDLVVFLTYFIEAIRVIFPNTVKNTQALLTAHTQPPIKELVISIVNEINQLDHFFVLVLDDFEVIQKDVVHDFLNEFLLHPPAGFHLVLCTRIDPLLSIQKFRAQSQITEIRAQDLRFSVEESVTFLQNILGETIEIGTVKKMDQQSEGWVTGLRLAALASRHRTGKQRIEVTPTANNRYVTDYLMTEILDSQTAVFSEWLLKTSILQRFNAGLCEAICIGENDGAGPPERDSQIDGDGFLKWLVDSNLFAIPLDDHFRWVRYHHLFRDFLQLELSRRYDRTKISALHIRASEFFAQQGLIGEALQHALDADDFSAAAQLVEQNRHIPLNEDKWPILEKWLAILPDEIVQQRPALLLAKAWVSNFQGAFWAISLILQTIDTMFEKEPLDQSLAGEINLFKAILLFWETQIEPSLVLFRRALEQLPGPHLGARNEAEIYFATASQMAGQGKMAIQAYQKILFNETSDGTRKIRLLASLIFIHLLSGELTQANDVTQQKMVIADRMDSTQYIDAWGSYFLGYINFQRNDLESASYHFSQALTNRFYLDQNSPIDCYAGLMFSYQAMGQSKKAIETMHSMLEFAQQSNNPDYLTLAYSAQARLSLLQGELKTAIHWLKTADISSDAGTMLFWIEMPRITHCRVLVSEGSDESLFTATECLQEYWHLSQATRNISQKIPILLLQALAYQKQSQTDKALAALENAITLAEPGGYIQPFLEPGTEMVQLLSKLVDQQGTTKYISKILDGFKPEQHVEMPKPIQPATQLIESLTNRELEILALLGRHLTNKEIAAELYISVGTVQQHLNHIYSKLGVKRRGQAIVKATELALLPTPK